MERPASAIRTKWEIEKKEGFEYLIGNVEKGTQCSRDDQLPPRPLSRSDSQGRNLVGISNEKADSKGPKDSGRGIKSIGGEIRERGEMQYGVVRTLWI